MKNISETDWKFAEEKVNELLEAYKELIGKPGVNPLFGLAVLHNAKQRLDYGERSLELYQDIMDLQ